MTVMVTSAVVLMASAVVVVTTVAISPIIVSAVMVMAAGMVIAAVIIPPTVPINVACEIYGKHRVVTVSGITIRVDCNQAGREEYPRASEDE
jgi:hypothetical protein